MAWRRRLAIAHTLLFVVALTAWTIALLSPVPQESARRVLGSAFWVFVFGKGLHISVYALLAVVGATLPLRGRTPGWVLVGLVAHGGVTEFFQQFVGRTASVRDVGLDALGVALGGLAVAGCRAARRWHIRQHVPAGEERVAG